MCEEGVPQASAAPAPDWTTPGAYEVAPGVHRIPLPMPNDGLRAVNVYVLATAGGCVLIDSGWALTEARSALEAALGELGYGLESISRFLVTHAHRDHYTLGIALQRTLGTKVAVGAGEQANIERATIDTGSTAARLLPMLGANHLVQDWMAAYPPAAREAAAASFGPPDEWIDGGAELRVGARTLTAIQTPGHTRGHLVFLDPAAGVLFTGDHVLPHITPSIGFEPARVEDPLGDYLRSLRLLLAYPDVRMLPAHGAPGESVHQRVTELLAHHEVRLEATHAAALAGTGTPFETARRIGWTRRLTPFEELTVFNQILAIGETYAHLVVLADRGRLRRHVDGAGVHCFEVSAS
ncbi:MAG: MBL fold metallo-hydrolase [Sporichthyaceae bacterium]